MLLYGLSTTSQSIKKKRRNKVRHNLKIKISFRCIEFASFTPHRRRNHPRTLSSFVFFLQNILSSFFLCLWMETGEREERVGGGRLITRQTWRFIFMGLFIALWTVLSLASQTEPSARVLRLCKQGNLPHSLGLYIGLTTSIAVPSKPLIALRRGNKAKQNGPIYFPKEHGASTCHPQTFRPLKKCNLVEKLKDTAELATVPKYLLSNFCRKKKTQRRRNRSFCPYKANVIFDDCLFFLEGVYFVKYLYLLVEPESKVKMPVV